MHLQATLGEFDGKLREELQHAGQVIGQLGTERPVTVEPLPELLLRGFQSSTSLSWTG